MVSLLSMWIEFKVQDCEPTKCTDKTPMETVSHLQYSGLEKGQMNSLLTTVKQRTDEKQS